MAAIQKEFIAGTVDPRDFNVLPPNVNNINSVSKDQTVFATITGVSNGALVWMPLRSASTMVLMVPAVGDTDTNTNCSAWGGDATSATNKWFIGTTAGYYFNAFYQPVQISPDFGIGGFTKFRSYSGFVHVKSDTTSTTTAAISGEMHAASISDVRGLRQLKVSDLVQQTTTKKDTVFSQRCYEGVVMTIGADITSDYIAPSARRVADDGWSALGTQYGPFSSPPGGAYTAASQYQGFGKEFAFVVPGVTTSSSGGTILQSTTTLPDIAWFECVDWEIQMYASQQIGGGATYIPVPSDTTTYDNLGVSDIFMAVDAATGSCIGKVYVARTYYPSLLFPNATDSVAGANGNLFPHILHHRCPKNVYSGTQQSGTFAAPAFSLAIEPNNLEQTRLMYVGTSFYVPVGFAINVTPVARSLYRTGNCGPARIATWTNVAAGQNIEVRGKVRSQLVSTGGIAPYTSSSGEKRAVNASLIPYVASLYNGPSPLFKRIYGAKEYEELCDALKKNVSLTLEREGHMLPDSMLREGLAAGIGDWIKSGVSRIHSAITKRVPVVGSLVSEKQAQEMADLARVKGCQVLCGESAKRTRSGTRRGHAKGMWGDSAGMFGESCQYCGSACGPDCTCGPCKARFGSSAAADEGRAEPAEYEEFVPMRRMF